MGIDPVTLAVRPDGREVWVSNHVSDSVSVIDVAPVSPTYLQVVATIQEFDPRTKATRFDEPCGIAFASNSKAYVALSSENEIAVIDVASRKVQKRLKVTAQDPRAIVVLGDRLYVLPFESNNKTQLSGGSKIDGKLVTFDAHEHSVANNNVLSLDHVTDIVKHPRVPDRDLFVFDTKTDRLLHSVETLGTLLYGLAVDSEGTVFIAQTDARNDANGRAGTQKHGLKELENRAFLNQITQLPFKKGKPEEPKFLNWNLCLLSIRQEGRHWLHHLQFRSATMTHCWLRLLQVQTNFLLSKRRPEKCWVESALERFLVVLHYSQKRRVMQSGLGFLMQLRILYLS